MPKPEIVAHRGGAGLWPENSLTAFRNALSLAVEQIELDVHLTADDQLVVIHDPTLDRTTGAAGPVYARTRKELAAIVPNGAAEGVATLGEALEILARTGFRLQIEIKVDANGVRYPAIEEKTVEAVRAAGLIERVIFGGFQPETVARLRQIAPETTRCGFIGSRTAQIAGGIEPALRGMAEAGANYAGLQHTIVDDMVLSAARALGLGVGVWTVNEPADLERWVKKPVDFITTDRPDLALAARGV